MNKPIPADVLAPPTDCYSTHEVLNQAQPVNGFNAFANDVVLRDAIERDAP